ncbi:MAG: hypothetical protein R3A45_08870 [Bdellovibrionota bacterium]
MQSKRFGALACDGFNSVFGGFFSNEEESNMIAPAERGFMMVKIEILNPNISLTASIGMLGLYPNSRKSLLEKENQDHYSGSVLYCDRMWPVFVHLSATQVLISEYRPDTHS